MPAARLGDLHGPDADRCRELRRALGIDASDDAPPFVTGDGTPVDASDVRFRRMASLTALSLETNGGMCRDLLRVRYGEESSRMKAARVAQVPRGAEGRGDRRAEDLGPLDVIVKIGAAGLCRTDLHIQEGQWAEKSGVELPYVPGTRTRAGSTR